MEKHNFETPQIAILFATDAISFANANRYSDQGHP